jgi:hypothetical protein
MGFKGTSGRSLKEHKEVPGLTKHIFDEIEYMYLGKSELVSVTRDKIGRYLLKFNLQFELVAGNTTEHSVVVKLSPATHNQAATPQRALTFSSVDDLEDEE